MLWAKMFDYIVVGGGIGGSVVSHRLHQSDPSLKILLVEAGPDVSGNTQIPYSNYTPYLVGSQWDWGYYTEPQAALNGRRINNPAGKCLGGGTALNSCGWMRGDSSDFDLWADLVDDDQYNYENMLPYFKRTEEYYNPDLSPGQHGADGPLFVASTTSAGRQFPLRDQVAEAWDENGVDALPDLDGNAGHNQGRAELTEDRRDGLRQLASSAYDLGGVTVLTETLVKRITLSKAKGTVRATGIELVNGTRYHGKEIIASAGSYRTPQLLMLSGIGPEETLSELGIDPIVNAPEVGQNLHDHLEFQMFWKLKDPSAGYAVGSDNPLFSQPEFGTGMPLDWVVTTTVPQAGLISAIQADEGQKPAHSHPLLRKARSFLEHFVIYAAGSAADPVVPADGSHIMTTMVHFLPTSKGYVTINSADPSKPPVIDPQYYTTQVDQYAIRQGIRDATNLMLGTAVGKSLIAQETAPDDFDPITLNATDAYIDARYKHNAFSTYHPMGSCSMGKVVDTDFRVYGVKGLRVVDASVFPNPITAHIQAATYGMAEKAAAVILGSN
ncbi:hypothetical protein FE257_010104 [Aspergillus nanangensis]|uniref:Glucose-methanol-choline oxidoreductase N-terminal domain-containing protein n=1 Tax=Aspergillus nanangensis TaxID=2582783 RepID=A0AAD4CJ59_ASPNN|nr:hypothetical protein FE257_010104 [Aspergillus nanangensis]